MNITEAMRKSQRSGRDYCRESIGTGAGWLSYDADRSYSLTADDLLAEDWISVELYDRKYPIP